MYVPALAGLKSHEVGHRNFQHPARTGNDFGEYLDNFSAWVIFASITAVSLEPRVWQLLQAGDESLLFRREVFESPRTAVAAAAATVLIIAVRGAEPANALVTSMDK